MTDVSDGLMADLGHVAQASGVGIDVSTAALKTDYEELAGAAAATGADAWAWVLGGGEDHALVAAFPGQTPEGWRVIVAVAEGNDNRPAGTVTVDGEPYEGDQGHAHFRS